MIRYVTTLLVILATCVFAEDTVRRNFSWSLEGSNDPILQLSNEGEKARKIEVRLFFGEDSYRYPADLEIPSGENRFLRIREVLDRVGDRYEEVKQQGSGILQIEFEGVDREIHSRLVNLNPKTGITTDKDAETLAPVIRSIDPKSGSPAGGAVITIVGDHFDNSTAVRFAGIPAMHNIQSKEVLIAIVPPHAAGAVDVEVSNGNKTASLRKAFRYEWDSPLIQRLNPDSGPARGGVRVQIEGRNFQQGSTVMWAGKSVPVRYISSESLSVVAPEGRSGSVAVEVVNPDGKRFALQDAFSYKGLPHITAVNPRMGSAAGGYTITVSGDHFEQGCSVMFGSLYGQTTFISPNSLAAVVPPGESGSVDITVSNQAGEKDTLADAFLYNEPPQISSVRAEPNPIVRNTTTKITVEASDPEAEALDYEYRVAQGPAGGAVSGQGKHAIYQSPNTIGIAIIQIIVYDPHRAKAQSTIEIQVE